MAKYTTRGIADETYHEQIAKQIVLKTERIFNYIERKKRKPFQIHISRNLLHWFDTSDYCTSYKWFAKKHKAW